MSLALGLDCGSAYCKGALVSTTGELLALAFRPTGWDFSRTGEEVLTELRARTATEYIPVVATGYGRARIAGVVATPTEIGCHARGAARLRPGVSTVVDIGGQDTKVITVDKRGRAKSFQMNNKCAAGTGRFLDLALNRLGVNFSKLDTFLANNLQIRLNSLCVVFAESEITGLLAEGRGREEILGGVVTSLADKTTALAARVDLQPPVILTGGLAESRGIAKALSRALGLEVQPTTHGFYAGAIGAAETALHGI